MVKSNYGSTDVRGSLHGDRRDEQVLVHHDHQPVVVDQDLLSVLSVSDEERPLLQGAVVNERTVRLDDVHLPTVINPTEVRDFVVVGCI